VKTITARRRENGYFRKSVAEAENINKYRRERRVVASSASRDNGDGAAGEVASLAGVARRRRKASASIMN